MKQLTQKHIAVVAAKIVDMLRQRCDDPDDALDALSIALQAVLTMSSKDVVDGIERLDEVYDDNKSWLAENIADYDAELRKRVAERVNGRPN